MKQQTFAAARRAAEVGAARRRRRIQADDGHGTGGALGFRERLNQENGTRTKVEDQDAGHAVSALGAKYILKEDVSGMRWAGVLLICIGILIVVTG